MADDNLNARIAAEPERGTQMTVKTKPRKAPAKAVTLKAMPAERPDVKATDARDIPRLVSRWKWLEADQEYQIDNAATDKESEELQFLHKKELDQIAEKLARAFSTHLR
jgi:hypothetical protein